MNIVLFDAQLVPAEDRRHVSRRTVGRPLPHSSWQATATTLKPLNYAATGSHRFRAVERSAAHSADRVRQRTKKRMLRSISFRSWHDP
jgi:uncharacterized ParB-like nuclease family protein